MIRAAGVEMGGATLGMLLADIVPHVQEAGRIVTGLASDSRHIEPGDVFLACPGFSGHGLDYLDEAIHRGASLILYDEPGLAAEMRLAEIQAFMPVLRVPGLSRHLGLIASRFHGHPSSRLQVFGITGTNGKTSCSHYIAQALTRLGRPCAVMGTLGYGLLDALHTPRGDRGLRTTPDALTLQAELAGLDAEAVAMEVSSHGIDQGRVEGVRFAAAIFTNLSRDHLDYHCDIDRYGRCKARLFELEGLGQAIVNADDAFTPALLEYVRPECEVAVYGLDEAAVEAARRRRSSAVLKGRIVASDGEGMTLSISSDWGRTEFQVPLLGRFNASNVLACLGLLLMQSIPFEAVCEALVDLHPVPGRMEVVPLPSGGRVVIDYAHTPDALQQVLETLRSHCEGRLTCLFGCGGERDRGKRPLMGRVAEALSDRVVLTDDNPRGEDPGQIVDEIRAGMVAADHAEVIHDRGAAICHLLEGIGRGDIALIAGKGHETCQWIGREALPWDDRAFVRRWAGGRP